MSTSRADENGENMVVVALLIVSEKREDSVPKFNVRTELQLELYTVYFLRCNIIKTILYY